MIGRRTIFCGLVLFAIVGGCTGSLDSNDGGNETPASFDPAELALVRVDPADGESSVQRNRVVRLFFNTTVLPSSVHDQSIRIRSGGQFQTRPEGSFLISGNIIEFDPTVTSTGGANALGFSAGIQILLDIPLFDGQAAQLAQVQPANLFLQNVEGNPIAIASGDNKITFSTGATWNDTVPGPPGALGLEFTPAPNAVGQVPATGAVTVVFDEAVNPETVVLSKNLFLTNNTSTSSSFQQDIPSITFFDGALTRYTFLPVFGFGTGPFEIAVNFIDPDDPSSFSPAGLPTDLGGNPVQNFTFLSTFPTQFDPTIKNTNLLREDFVTAINRDGNNTDAAWGDDPTIPFALVGLPVTTRNVQVNVVAITMFGGGSTVIDNPPVGVGEEDYCPTVNPLIGSDLIVANTQPPTSEGRRQLNLYRAEELGGNGTVIRVAWGPDSDATFAATYGGTILRLGHKQHTTSFATSGFFAQFDVDGFVEVVSATNYTVPQAADINGGTSITDGYLDWPSLTTFFDYNGSDELVLDVEAQEGNTFQQFRTYMNYSQPFGNCNCFTQFIGQCQPDASLGSRQFDTTYNSDQPNPSQSFLLGVFNPSPFVHVMEFEMAKLRSDGQSTYYDTNSTAPDYLAPIISPAVQPGGSIVIITWSGSKDGIMEDVPFTTNINAVDDHQFIRWHAILRANLFTKARSRIQLIELPYEFP